MKTNNKNYIIYFIKNNKKTSIVQPAKDRIEARIKFESKYPECKIRRIV